jgi:phage tail sheath protein FI
MTTAFTATIPLNQRTTIQLPKAPTATLNLVSVQRMSLYIEQSLTTGLQWVAFQANTPTTWATIRQTAGNFMNSLFRQGVLHGTTPQSAYFVTCDSTTMTQTDIDNGHINLLVGFAPQYPAEFVILQIGLWTNPPK